MKTSSLPVSQKQLSLLDRARQQANEKLDFWKPDKPEDGIQGTVVKVARGGKFNSLFVHTQTENGIQIIAAGETTVLGKKLIDLEIGVGDRIGVLYLGEKKSASGATYMDWSVVAEKREKPKGALGIFGNRG
jgi:hypothetical protein